MADGLLIFERSRRRTLGHELDSEYVETFYLPTVGPTATLILRKLHRLVPNPGDRACIPAAALAAGLGISPKTSRHAPLMRALHRLVRYDALLVRGEDLFIVPTRLFDVSPALRSCWHPSLVALHDTFTLNAAG